MSIYAHINLSICIYIYVYVHTSSSTYHTRMFQVLTVNVYICTYNTCAIIRISLFRATVYVLLLALSLTARMAMTLKTMQFPSTKMSCDDY